MHTAVTAPTSPTLHYLLDGEPITLKDLLAVNDLEADVVVQLRNLRLGQTLAVCGATLTRVEATS